MKLKFFNLIEVTLAIAVVGIGIAGIMSMFPVALNSNRDAIGNSYSSMIADQFLSFAALKASADSAAGKAWTDSTSFIGSTLLLETKPTDESSVVTIDGKSSASTSAVYKMAMGTTGVTDFTAIIRIWKSQIKNVYVGGYQITSVAYKYAARINIEVSWPAELPYNVRQKRFYSIELYNSNPK